MNLDKLLESTKRTKISKRLVYGVGLNDSTFQTTIRISGKIYTHTCYKTWKDMLKRCYSPNYKQMYKTYDGVFVCEEWKSFNNFYEWWIKNYVVDYELDKDLLNCGNKIYSPKFCIYIPRELNNFCRLHQKKGTKEGRGVLWYKKSNTYHVRLSVDGKSIFVGACKTVQEAEKLWKEQKLKLAETYKEICDKIHPNLFSGLIKTINSV